MKDTSAELNVDSVLNDCMQYGKPKSFFLFAGAGSGKTSSLIRLLENFRKKHSDKMNQNSQKVAIVTYTNVACDVIKSRLDFDPMFKVSTIHSFIWDLIQGFDMDIKAWLKDEIQNEIRELEQENSNPKAKSGATAKRVSSIEFKEKRLEILPNISKFIYSPIGENRARESLNHSEVIKIGAHFISNKALMRKLLIQKYPFLLIDESQDTHKLLVDALFKVQSLNKEQFGLGLFGDTMQRIYSEGKADIDKNLPKDWATPAKKLNYRCPPRIVELINKIRISVDSQQQTAMKTDSDGIIRFYISNSIGVDRSAIEKLVRKKMAFCASDQKWNTEKEVKTLILEHHMAAKRLDFNDLFKPLDKIPEFKDPLRRGDLPILRLFSKNILPLWRAMEEKNDFKIASIVKKYSPIFEVRKTPNSTPFKGDNVRTASAAVLELSELFTRNTNPTFMEVLSTVSCSKLFHIPEELVPFSEGEFLDFEEFERNSDDRSDKQLAIHAFLRTPFKKIENYDDYFMGKSPFGTHQGVKGDEFERVMAVLDDEEAGGFLFGYEKVFNAKEKTPTDLKNEKEGKETGNDRTRRLLYVICSRSRESLAVVMYSSEPQKAKCFALAQGWFEDHEIEILNHEKP